MQPTILYYNFLVQSVYSECVLDIKCEKCNSESFWSEGKIVLDKFEIVLKSKTS